MPAVSRLGRRLLPVVRPVGVAVLLALTLAIILRATGMMDRLFFYPTAAATEPPRYLKGVEPVWFESADGTRLHGWFIHARPAGEGGAAAPTVLHVHGNAGNIESHIEFSEALPAAGFNLFIFDYRGYGRSGGRARRRVDLIADAEAALDALLARADVDPDRIGLFGHSLGGAIGLELMRRRPEVAAAVIEAAFTSWREIAASAVGGDPPGWLGRTLATVLVADHARPIDAIAAIDRPILILHGSADGIIPISHGHRLADAATSATLVELEGGDHNSLRMTHPEVDTLVIEFFARHLGLERGGPEHGGLERPGPPDTLAGSRDDAQQ